MSDLGMFATYAKVKLTAREWKKVLWWCNWGFDEALRWLNVHKPIVGRGWTLQTELTLREVVDLLAWMCEKEPRSYLFTSEYRWLLNVLQGDPDWTDGIWNELEHYASLPKEVETNG